jgi:phage FluMu protein Com
MTRTYVCETCHKTIFKAHGSTKLRKCARCCRIGG